MAKPQIPAGLPQEIVDELTELSAKVDEMEDSWKTLRKQASNAKKDYDDGNKRLRKYIAHLNNPTPELQFPDDSPADEAAKEHYANAEQPEVSSEAPKGPPPGTAWRAITIDCLAEHGLGKQILKKLATSNILNMGDYFDYYSSHDGSFTDISGIGASANDAILQAEQAFWADYASQPAPVLDSVEPDPETPDDDATDPQDDDGDDDGGDDSDDED